MKIDLTCPVELWQYAMPSGESEECSFLMNNLSGKTVTSVQVTMTCYSAGDEELLRQTERVQGLNAPSGRSFTVSFVPDRWEDVEGVDLVIEKVWFDDATVWRRGNASLTRYTSNALAPGRDLDSLRFVAGSDAVGYPQRQEEAWVCVCGRANAYDSGVCCRCGRGRDSVFASFSRENVGKLNDLRETSLNSAGRKAREENNVLQENREKQFAAGKRRRRRALRLTLTGIAAALLIAAGVIWGVPAAKYLAAENLLNKGGFGEARELFVSLQDYRDSAEKITECDYREAVSLAESGEPENLELAQSAFEKLGEYSGSAEKAKQTAYALGENYLECGYYEAAAEKFASLGDWEDSAERCRETVYTQAAVLKEEGSFEAARLLFAGLEDYRDAETQEIECGYLLAKRYLEEGSYEAALGELEDLSGYEDVDELVRSARYALAEERLLAGDAEGAAEMYLAAGDYQDAPAKAAECLLKQAQELLADGRAEEALQICGRIPGEPAAAELAAQCRYTLAGAAAEAEDWEGAIARYGDAAAAEDLSEDDRALLAECHYQLSQKALVEGDPEAAEAELENAADYGKGRAELNKLRYQLAENAFEAADFADALPRYLALATYKNSAARVKQCRYALAQAALEAGDNAAAMEYYSALGKYKDSEKQLKDVSYLRAMELYAAGDRAAAVEILAGLTGSKAKAALADMEKERAAELEAEGSFLAAAEVYDALKTDDARELYRGAMYRYAGTLAEAGDWLNAGAEYAALEDFSDAPEKAAECFEKYWGNAAAWARALMEKKDYAGVVAVLDGLDLNDLAKAYPDLPDLLREAAYLRAEELYGAGEPYAAIPYYQRCGSYKDADTKKLTRNAYLLLGEWVSAAGTKAEFRPDGTCAIGGEEFCFRASGFSLYTGADAQNMSITHKLTSVTEDGLTLRDIRNGADDVTHFGRAGEWTLPVMDLPEYTPEPYEEPETSPAEETPAEAPAPEEAPAEEDLSDMLVEE